MYILASCWHAAMHQTSCSCSSCRRVPLAVYLAACTARRIPFGEYRSACLGIAARECLNGAADIIWCACRCSESGCWCSPYHQYKASNLCKFKFHMIAFNGDSQLALGLAILTSTLNILAKCNPATGNPQLAIRHTKQRLTLSLPAAVYRCLAALILPQQQTQTESSPAPAIQWLEFQW